MGWEVVIVVDLDGQEIGQAIYDNDKRSIIRPFRDDPQAVMPENDLRLVIKAMKKKHHDLTILEGSITEDDLNEKPPS